MSIPGLGVLVDRLGLGTGTPSYDIRSLLRPELLLPDLFDLMAVPWSSGRHWSRDLTIASISLSCIL